MKFWLSAVLFAFSMASAQAVLVLNVDIPNQNFWLTGSGVGNVTSSKSIGFGRAPLGTPIGNELIDYDNGQTFTTSVGSVGNNAFNYDTRIATNSINSGTFFIEFVVSDQGLQTFSGLGNPLSYADLFSNPLVDGDAIMQALIDLGTVNNITGASGTEAITVVAAVPEPSSYAMIFAVSGFAYCLYRRRR